MNKSVFEKITNQSQQPRVDRFILPRESFIVERKRRSWRVQFENDPVDIWQVRHQNQRKYKSYLDDVFGMDPIRCKEPKGQEHSAYIQAWPCAPRRRSYLSSADSILDLPTYSYAMYPELLDWSSTNILVAALGINYHMFNWDTQTVTSHGYSMFEIQSCKFSPDGNKLLIGTKIPGIEIHDAVNSKRLSVTYCNCWKEMTIRRCHVSAVQWSPTGNSFVTGCSRGRVNSFDSLSLLPVYDQRLSRAPILAIRVSPDTRFVAVVTLNSPTVHVLVWPSLEYHACSSSHWIVKSIAWHPWRSALLGIVLTDSELGTAIAMWDHPSRRLRVTKLGLNEDCNIDVMLFSHRTGELVLSLWNAENAVVTPRASTRLVVMSDPNTVVDQSGGGKQGLDRVRTMVFNPDGTKLATATADEDLIIWNFLPEDQGRKNTRSKKFSMLPVYLDKLTHGFVLR